MADKTTESIKKIKKIYSDMSGDPAAWDHIEMHLKQAAPVIETAEEVQTDGKES